MPRAEPCPRCREPFVLTFDSGVTWKCSKCTTPCASEERKQAELATLKAVEAVDAIEMSDRAAASVRRGINVGVLKSLAANFEGTTADFVAKKVRPKTASTHGRYIEALAAETPRAMGTATSFISHTWRVPFRDTVAAISHVFPDSAYVWLDVFAVRQWLGNAADADFRGVIGEVSSLLLCVTHLSILEKNLVVIALGANGSRGG